MDNLVVYSINEWWEAVNIVFINNVNNIYLPIPVKFAEKRLTVTRICAVLIRVTSCIQRREEVNTAQIIIRKQAIQ